MISTSGERRVLDFGIAKALEESRELGTDIGRTIAYASPERLVSDQVNPHADFWSLGVMLYEMVCGHRPYPHLEGPRFRRELEQAITSNAQRAPLPASCPGSLKAIINKLLAFQVEHRYPNAGAIRADLEAFRRGDVPAAVSIYETPATTPVQRTGALARSVAQPAPDTLPRSAAPATVPATVPRPGPDVPPTDINPAAAAAPVEDVLGVAVATPLAAPLAKPRSVVRDLGSTLVVVFVVFVVATEGVAWLFAEGFRDSVAAIDERTVTERRTAYARLDRWALLDLGLRVRVHPRLRPALVSVGDRVIEDYRREEPSMGPSAWAEAHQALTWARELSPRDQALRAKQLTAAAHVKRFESQSAPRGSRTTLLAEAALARFRDAADADPKSFDPYLGMARLQVYALSDVDGAAASIARAEALGYTLGRREKAQLGDGYLWRAEAARRSASVLTGEQRWRELTNARADYQRCVDFFDPIVSFANAAANLEKCKAQLLRVERQLDERGGGS
jgi:hypothetical protein